MDQVLKARKMGSASARRRKIQARHEQQAQDRQKFEQHKRRILMYDHRAERLSAHMDEMESALPDEADADTDAGESDQESSVDTQSERSAKTPDGMLQTKARLINPPLNEGHPVAALKIQIPDEDAALDELVLDENRIVIPPSPKPILQASLASWSDFRYDRYSTVLDSPLSETLSPELETDETFSPIETATPIAYQQPKSRPSLISIVTISPHGKRSTGSMQSPLSQTTSQSAERPAKRQSTNIVHSPFPAAEATLFEVPSLPVNAFELIANASQESLPLSVKEFPKSKADRKSSMPRLSTALSHARMSSIKSLIKTPTTPAASATANHRKSLSRPTSHISRPSTASIPAADMSIMKNPAALSSATNLISRTRPPTSHNSSSANNPTITALPSLPTPPADDDVQDPLASKPPMNRKKSFSALRRRSESIGQAIKGLSKMTSKYEVPMPMTPGITASKKAQPLDLSSFPTPPMPSPRTGQSSANSFTSSRTQSSGGFIGLGLRSVEGLSQR
jgi:hypothetical protein